MPSVRNVRFWPQLWHERTRVVAPPENNSLTIQ